MLLHLLHFKFLFALNSYVICQLQIWPKVKGVLEEQGALGPSLALVCREHNTTTRVETIEDFAKVPEGGCNRPCEKPLVCGHVCTKMCHAYDKDHLEYVCTQKCNRCAPPGGLRIIA